MRRFRATRKFRGSVVIRLLAVQTPTAGSEAPRHSHGSDLLEVLPEMGPSSH